MKKAPFKALAAVPLLLMSCIAAEQQGTECDIETVALHFDRASDYFYNDFDTLKTVISTDSLIVFTIRSYADVNTVPLSVRVTPGAHLFLINEEGAQTPFVCGSAVDFSNEQERRFRVVSEDGVWSRNYTISIKHDLPSEGTQSINFDKYALLDPNKTVSDQGTYFVWDAPSFFTDNKWKNGNPGFKISRSSAKPMDYPSSPAAGCGHNGGDCLKLETCDTGAFGRLNNMRIAAGSMFNGVFDVANAIKATLKATQFGSPFGHKPIQLRVWLRYEPGATFQDRAGKAVAGVVDEPDAYCLLYRNRDKAGNRVMLDGTDVLSNAHIIGKGRLTHYYTESGSDFLTNTPIHGVTSEWQEFIIPIEYSEEPDPEILENMGYNIAICFSSSWQGAHFQGAIGSKLYVDDIRLICE